MAFGLGHNSPVVLSQSKTNFEALIARHGQWLRWRVAKKCPCITKHNRPDVHCVRCGGSGDFYDYQREYEDIFRTTARENVIPIPDSYTNAHVIEVYNSRGIRFEFVRHDNFLQVTGSTIPNNEYLEVRICVPIVQKLESANLIKAGGGYYRIPGICTEPSEIDRVYYQAAGDVISVEEMEDIEGNTVKAKGFRRDMIFVDSKSGLYPVRYTQLSGVP